MTGRADAGSKMEEKTAEPAERIYIRAIALTASGSVLAIALLCLAAFLLDAPTIGGVFPNGIPMAPATALCFLLLSGMLLLWQTGLPWKRRAIRAAAALIFLIAVGVLFRQAHEASRSTGIPLWQMSPFTAGLFMLSALALLRLARARSGPDNSFITVCAVLLALSALILLGYLYGSPFFYGGTVIPVAFPTGLAFLVLSAALFASDPESILATPFYGSSLKATLFRNFLPLVLAAVVMDKFLDLWQPAFFTSKPALDALHALLAMSAAAWLAGRISKRVGDKVALAQLKLKKLNRDLAESKQDMENLLYVTTHDLRGPLVNIHGFSENMLKDMEKLREALKPAVLPEPSRDLVNELASGSIPVSLNFITGSVASMNRVINTLLKVARLGQVEMRPEKLELNALLKDVIDTLRFQLEEAGCAVKAGDLPPCKADAGAMTHIFTNLLANAIKYRDKARKLEITVSGERTGDAVRYTIADNGLGIKEENLPRIWEFFYSGAVPGVEKGEGIGLPMIRRMAVKNRGRIWAESKEGAGSTFFVEMPAV